METQTTAPQTPADRAGTVGNETKQATKDVAATAGQEAKQVTREAKDQVRQLWGQTRSDLTNQASTQQTRAASGLRELADQLGQMAGGADSDGMAKGLVEDVSRRAHDAAQWLDSRDPGSLLEEARSFARQRPGTFLAIAAGVGVLAGRLSRGLVDEARDSDSSSGTGYARPTTARPTTAPPTTARRSTRRRPAATAPAASVPRAARGHRHPDRHEPDDVDDRVHADHAGGLVPRPCPRAWRRRRPGTCPGRTARPSRSPPTARRAPSTRTAT